MDVEKILSFWVGWKVVGQIGEPKEKLYQVVNEQNNIKEYATVKIVSVNKESDIWISLVQKGLIDNVIESYLQDIIKNFTDRLNQMKALSASNNIIKILDYRLVNSDIGVGWDIFILLEMAIPLKVYVLNRNLTEADVAKFGVDICNALEIYEKNNTTYPYISLESVYISSSGEYKIGDFSVPADTRKINNIYTDSKALDYIAPEVIRGESNNCASSIYSLGLLMYEFMNGNRLPFVETYQNAGVVERKAAQERRIRGEYFAPPVNASKDMSEIIMTACSFEPGKRFITATALKRALLSVSQAMFGGRQRNMQMEDANKVENYVPQTEQANTSVSVKTKKKTKKVKKSGGIFKIILAVILALVLVCAGIFAFLKLRVINDPSNKVIDALAQGEYEYAIEIYNKLDETNNTLIEGLKKRIDTVYNDYRSGSKEYAMAIQELDTISKMNVASVSSKLSEVKNKIEQLNTSNTAFETAKTFEKNQDYANAIVWYKKVVEEDSNYETAKSNMNTAMQKYRSSTLDEAKNYADSQNYESAVKILNAALNVLSNDTEITTQRTIYIEKYESDCIAQADKLLAERKYDDAKNLLLSLKELVPDSTKISQKISEIDSLRPVALEKLVVIDSGEYEFKQSLFTDSYGNNYNGAHYYNAYNSSAKTYSVHNLNKAYTNLSGTIVAQVAMRSDAEVSIVIYVDDVMKYTKTNYDKRTGSIDFNVDVLGGSKLTIEVVCTQNYNGKICIVNGQLYK